jgi:hypothetical protein
MPPKRCNDDASASRCKPDASAPRGEDDTSAPTAAELRGELLAILRARDAGKTC